MVENVVGSIRLAKYLQWFSSLACGLAHHILCGCSPAARGDTIDKEEGSLVAMCGVGEGERPMQL
jgi:hypothetical protein